MGKRRPANPFYVLLVIAGVVFCVTASAYGVMTVKGLHPDIAAQQGASGLLLLAWLDEHGFRLLMGELAVLAVFTFAAIGTDDYWSRCVAADTRPGPARGEQNRE
jgi:hypothetical protein